MHRSSAIGALLLSWSLALAVTLAGAVEGTDPALAPADRIATAWLSQQAKSGRFRDWIVARTGWRSPGATAGRDRYGSAMLGAAMLRYGRLKNDQRLLTAGLNGLLWACRNPSPQFSVSRRFEDLALAEGYRAIGRTGSALQRSEVRECARQVMASPAGAAAPALNQELAQALTVLELTATELQSDVPGAVLADPATARAAAIASVDGIVTRLEAERQDVAGVQTGFVGDEPSYPLAYHALTSALLFRASRFLPEPEATRAGRRAREAVATTLLVTAPDGSLAYLGRSTEQSWALAMTAYAARSTGSGRKTTDLGTRALGRLETHHRSERYGMWLIPAMREDQFGSIAALDGYAAASSYTGLTLLGLGWAATMPRPTAVVPPSPRMLVLGATAQSRLAIVSTDRVWAAIRGGYRTRDARYDPGLLSLKVRSGTGWTDLLAGRPIAGPANGIYLNESSGENALPSVELTSDGGWIRQYYSLGSEAIVVRYRPERCGLSVVVRPAAGTATMLRLPIPTDRAQTGPGTVTWAGGRITSSGGGAPVFSSTTGSATAARSGTVVLPVQPTGGETALIRIEGTRCP